MARFKGDLWDRSKDGNRREERSFARFAIIATAVFVLFMLVTLQAEAARATLIVFFLALDVLTSGFFIHSGLMSRQSLIDALVVLPFMWLGMWLGTRWFHSVDEAQFKRYVLLFLILVSVVGMGRALLR